MKLLFERWKSFMGEENNKDSQHVVKAIVYDEDGHFLVLHNDEDTFDLPGGHIHVGEPRLAGLKREVCEETGLNIDSARAEKVTTLGRTTFYVAPLPTQQIELSDEHSGYEKINFDKPESYNLSTMYTQAVELARELIDDK